MTWAEHVSRIGNIQGVSIKLGYGAAHLSELAQRLRADPHVMGPEDWDSDDKGSGILALSLPYYESRTIRVRGKPRSLLIPTRELKHIQIGIRELLRPAAEELLHPSCHGYRPNHSTFSNALPHCGATYIQKFDISEFFARTTMAMVSKMLANCGFDDESSQLIAGLATVNDALPLGAPCSPVVSNLMLADFDHELAGESAFRGVAYTRYADDLTLSSDQEFDMSDIVGRLLAVRGYELASDKTARARRGQNLTVTGLVTWDGELPRLPKAFRRRLETELYFVERYGLEEHAFREYRWAWIEADDEPEKHVEQSARHLRGKLMYALGIQRSWTRALLARYPKAVRLIVGGAPDAADRRSARIAFIERLAGNVRSRSTPQAPWLRNS